MAICTVQVTNVSPKANYQNVKELFSYFGPVDELKVYPEDEDRQDIPSKVCFVTFKERDSLEAALHLTNTLFIDRSLIVSQSRYEVIPEENTAMSLAPPAIPATLADPLLNPPAITAAAAVTPLLPTPQTPSLLGTPTAQPLLQNPIVTAIQQAQSVASSINANIQGDLGIGSGGTVELTDGLTLSALPPSLQQIISGNVDPTKIDEIRRTIYVGNLNSGLKADQVMNFFQACGEIKYVRMAGDETQPARFAFVEFTNPESVQIALQYNGAMFGDRPVKVNHSKNAIVKPQGKTPEMAQREVDEAMRRVREATQVISTSIDPAKKSRSRTRSRSRDRRRERSGRRRYSRSPSLDRHRKRSKSRSPRRQRRSPSPRRRDYGRGRRGRHSLSRSPDRYRSRRRSPDKRRGRTPSKSPSPPRHRRKRSRDRSRDRKKRRSPSRSPSPVKRRGRSPSRSPSPVKKRSKKSKKDKKRSKHSPSPSPRSKREKRKVKEEVKVEEDSDDNNREGVASDKEGGASDRDSCRSSVDGRGSDSD